MLKIRLAKTGKRNAPSYRVVVIPEERPRDGEVVEVLGYFNPSVEPPALKIDKGRLKHWLERGAQMTEAVEKLVKGRYVFKKYVPRKSREAEKGEGEDKQEEKEEQQGGQGDKRGEDKRKQGKEEKTEGQGNKDEKS